MAEINLDDLTSDKPKVKYACAKLAIAVSKDDPASLYPEFDRFIELLNGKNTILKWTAIQVIGNLSKVDGDNRVDEIIPELAALLNDKAMVTAANSIGAMAEIAKNKPRYRDEILKSLLGVENGEIPGPRLKRARRRPFHCIPVKVKINHMRS
jgi:hypothetical protein